MLYVWLRVLFSWFCDCSPWIFCAIYDMIWRFGCFDVIWVISYMFVWNWGGFCTVWLLIVQSQILVVKLGLNHTHKTCVLLWIAWYWLWWDFWHCAWCLRAWTRRTSAILAQASKARLGKNSRDSNLVMLKHFAQAESPCFGRQIISLKRAYLA